MSKSREKLTEPEVLDCLRARVAASPSQSEWARRNGISPAYLNDVLQGRRDPGEKIQKALGLKRHHVYERVSK